MIERVLTPVDQVATREVLRGARVSLFRVCSINRVGWISLLKNLLSESNGGIHDIRCIYLVGSNP